MAFQLDDLLRDDSKGGNLLPDLSKATCASQEEFRRLMECCPEFKIKVEKVKREDTKIRDKEFSWHTTRKELKSLGREWSYGDPIPPDMRVLDLQELQQVGIDWRMLTSLRPKLRQDEEMFSRLVEMGKLQIKTQARERRNFSSPIRRAKNRAGIVESSVKVCGDCGEEFCSGESCGDVLYDSFIRVTVTPSQEKARITANAAAIIAGMDANAGKSGKKKRKYNVPGMPRGGKSSKAARLLVRKGNQNGSKSRGGRAGGGKGRKGRRQSGRGVLEGKRSGDEAKDEDGKRKFRRKCSKYQAGRKKNAS